MISKTDSTLFVYSTEHILVKVYTGARGPRQRFQSACEDAPSDAFLAGAIQSAARSGRFSVEAGTRACVEAWGVSCSARDLFLTDQKLSQIWTLLGTFGKSEGGCLPAGTRTLLRYPAGVRTKSY